MTFAWWDDGVFGDGWQCCETDGEEDDDLEDDEHLATQI